MGIINYGTQTQVFDYKQPATGQGFSKLNYKTLPSGIYEGFTLTKVDNVTVTISTGVCIIDDPSTSTRIKISTSATQNIAISPSTPYIILRYAWVNIENNYMDMMAVAYGSLQAGDLIIGRGIYSGSTLANTFDYSLKSIASLQVIENNKNSFRVIPTEPISKTVTVEDGTCIINGVYIDHSSAVSGTISDTTLGRYDIIYLDDTGSIQVLQGTDASSPTAPDYPVQGLVVAEIHRGASRTDVNGTDIVQIKPDRNNPNVASVDVQNSTTAYNSIIKNGNYRVRSATNSPNGTNDPFFLVVKNYNNGQTVFQEASKIGINYANGLIPFFRPTAVGAPASPGIGQTGTGITGTFFYVVCARTNSGISTPCAEQTITVTNKTVQVTWSALTTYDSVIGYRVFKGTVSGTYTQYQDVTGVGTGTVTFNDAGAGWSSTPPDPPTTDGTGDTTYVLRQTDKITINVTLLDASIVTLAYTKADADAVYTASQFKSLMDTQFSSILPYIEFNVDTGFTTKVRLKQNFSNTYQIVSIEFIMASLGVSNLVDETYSLSETASLTEYYRVRGQDLVWSSWRSRYSNNFEFLNSYFIGNKNSTAAITYNANLTMNTVTLTTTDDNYTTMVITYAYNSDLTTNYVDMAFYMNNSLLETYRQTYTYSATTKNITNITCVKQ